MVCTWLSSIVGLTRPSGLPQAGVREQGSAGTEPVDRRSPLCKDVHHSMRGVRTGPLPGDAGDSAEPVPDCRRTRPGAAGSRASRRGGCAALPHPASPGRQRISGESPQLSLRLYCNWRVGERWHDTRVACRISRTRTCISLAVRPAPSRATPRLPVPAAVTRLETYQVFVVAAVRRRAAFSRREAAGRGDAARPPRGLC